MNVAVINLKDMLKYLGRTYVELKKRPIYIIKEEVIKDNK